MTLELNKEQAALILVALSEKRERVINQMAIMPSQFVSVKDDLVDLHKEIDKLIALLYGKKLS